MAKGGARDDGRWRCLDAKHRECVGEAPRERHACAVVRSTSFFSPFIIISHTIIMIYDTMCRIILFYLLASSRLYNIILSFIIPVRSTCNCTS